MDGDIKSFGIGEGLMGEVVGFEIAPNDFNVVQFRRIFRQPFNSEPMGAGCERFPGGFAGMDRAIIKDNYDRFGLHARPGAVKLVQFLKKGDEIRAAFRPGRRDNQPASFPVERAHHGNLSGLTRCGNTQIRPALCPASGQIRVCQSLALIGK